VGHRGNDTRARRARQSLRTAYLAASTDHPLTCSGSAIPGVSITRPTPNSHGRERDVFCVSLSVVRATYRLLAGRPGRLIRTAVFSKVRLSKPQNDPQERRSDRAHPTRQNQCRHPVVFRIQHDDIQPTLKRLSLRNVGCGIRRLGSILVTIWGGGEGGGGRSPEPPLPRWQRPDTLQSVPIKVVIARKVTIKSVSSFAAISCAAGGLRLGRCNCNPFSSRRRTSKRCLFAGHTNPVPHGEVRRFSSARSFSSQGKFGTSAVTRSAVYGRDAQMGGKSASSGSNCACVKRRHQDVQ